MKTIFKLSIKGMLITIIVWILFSTASVIKYIRMSLNSCVPENLYTFFHVNTLWHLIIAGSIIMPILVWLLPKLPQDKKPMPKWLELIVKGITAIIITFALLAGICATILLFTKNPCQ